MKTFIAIILFIGFYSTVFAQSLSVQDAIQITLKNSLEIELSKNIVAASKNNNYYGVAGGLPSIAASGSDIQQQSNINQNLNTGTSIERKGANVNNASANVTAGILLYNGSRVIATKKRLTELQQQSETQLNAQIQNIIASVMTAYYDVIRQQYFLKTVNQSFAVAQQKLELVKIQQKAGLANNADLFQSQLDYNTLNQTQQSQILVINQSKAELLRVMNLNQDSTIEVEDTIIIDPSITLNTIIDNIPANFDIITADHQIRIQELRIKEIAAQRYPSLNGSAGYNYNRTQSEAGQLLLNQSNGPFVGMTLGIPIYSGSSFKRQQISAEYDASNARLQKDILLRDYKAAVVKAFQSYTSSIRQLNMQQNSLDTAQKLLELIMLKFKLKQATIIDVKTAQQSFETTSYNLINLKYSAKAAEIQLKRLANTLKL
jgi:outer membrane protein